MLANDPRIRITRLTWFFSGAVATAAALVPSASEDRVRLPRLRFFQVESASPDSPNVDPGAGNSAMERGGISNDECSAAATLACNSATLIDNSLATVNPADPNFLCRNGPDSAGWGTVWYSIVASAPEVVIATCNDQPGSPNDSLLQVFSGTCAALGSAIGCVDDNCGTTTGFLGTILLAGLSPGHSYIVELAAWDAGAGGRYELALDCDQSGACCRGVSVCDQQSPAACVDLGGVWFGEDTPCANATCVEPPLCPPGAIDERIEDPSCGQPVPDTGNSGCSISGGVFTFLPSDGCGIAVTGDASADARPNAGGRDTDWMFLTPSETKQYTACVTAQFHPEVQFWKLSAGLDPCADSAPRSAAHGRPGEAVCATQCLLGQLPYAIRVTIVDASGAPQHFGVGCSDYCLTITCSGCATGACCLPDGTCVADVFPCMPLPECPPVTRVACEERGGVYLGDGSTCAAGNPCEGACCQFNGECVRSSQTSCLADGGSWALGADCADVMPCVVCQGEDPNDYDGLSGIREDCSSVGSDLVNAGCSASSALHRFTPIACGQTVCASGSFDGAFRDVDWFQLSVDTVAEINFQVENNLAGQLILRVRYYPNQQPGATGDPCATAGALELLPPATGVVPSGQSATFPMVLAPARYTLLAAYDFQSPGLPVAPCPSPYRITVQCVTRPCGDSNLDGVVSVSDIGAFVVAVTQGFEAWDASIPGPQANLQFICANDTNRDGAVTVSDIGVFVQVVTGAGDCPGACVP